MAGEELLELSLALNVVVSEVLSVGIVHRCCAQGVKHEAAANVQGYGVLDAIVPQALDSGHYQPLLINYKFSLSE